ncbi:secreted protein [Melampsora americana]|nr:secreted protein [Melampsora americana]
MMMKLSNSKLKFILLIWAVVNMNFCVKGRPSMVKDAAQLVEDAKEVTTGTRGDDGVKNLELVNEMSHKKPDDPNLGTTETLQNPQTGSREGSVNLDESGTPTTKGLKDEQGLEKDLKPTPKSEQTKALKTTGVSDLKEVPETAHIKPFGEKMEFLQPDKVRTLSDDALIRYMAEKDSRVKIPALDLREITRGYKKGAYTQYEYDKAYKTTLEAARQLVSEKSLTPEALSKLTNEEYVQRAALFDKDVYPAHAAWMIDEGLLRATVNQFYWKVSNDFKDSAGEEKLNQVLKGLTETVRKSAKDNKEPTDPSSIRKAVEREFIKENAKLYPNNVEFRQLNSRIKPLEVRANKAKLAALEGADRVFKSNNILKSSELRYKSTSWSFKNFMNKISAWFWKIMPSKSYWVIIEKTLDEE